MAGGVAMCLSRAVSGRAVFVIGCFGVSESDVRCEGVWKRGVLALVPMAVALRVNQRRLFKK